MKQTFIFLLLTCFPMVCLGDMVGFAGDTRRYVTESEKYQFPYNTVVRFDSDGNTGTGTFVSDDVILTCRHVVESTGIGNLIDYYTADGKKHSGIVAVYPENSNDASDYAIIIDENAFDKPVLEMESKSRFDNNLMVVGYDSLKPLSDSELLIVKRLYKDWLVKNGTITAVNAMQAIVDIEMELKQNHACSFLKTKDCVKCSSDANYCIFNDSENMKVRENCKVESVQGTKIKTNCPGAPGASGSALISSDRNSILGLNCNVIRPQIGQELNASSSAIKPEVYYKSVQSWIEGINSF